MALFTAAAHGVPCEHYRLYAAGSYGKARIDLDDIRDVKRLDTGTRALGDTWGLGVGDLRALLVGRICRHEAEDKEERGTRPSSVQNLEADPAQDNQTVGLSKLSSVQLCIVNLPKFWE